MIFKRKPNLDDVAVAAPCPTSWESMEGDDKVRYCSLCSLSVYNLSGMTRKEGETLMKSATGPMCIRLFRRKDGTLITKDCPVGRRVADAFKVRARALVVSLLACIQASPATSKEQCSIQSKVLEISSANDSVPENHSGARWGLAGSAWKKEEVPMPRGYAAPIPIGQGAYKQSSLESFKAAFGKPLSSLPAPLFRRLSPPSSFIVPDFQSGLQHSAASIDPSKLKKADTAALDAFNDAQRAEAIGFISRANVGYQFAIYQFIRHRNEHDPAFQKQVATAYAKFLKRQNQPEQASAILKEFCK